MNARILALAVVAGLAAGAGAARLATGPAAYAQVQPGADSAIEQNARRLLDEGRQTFRFDTFGDEEYWGGSLRLHQAIAGAANGGVGPGVSPKAALGVGLKVDVDALPADLVEQIRAGRVNLDDPATTLALLKLNAVVGLKGFFGGDGRLQSVGITCAVCHSAVDNAFSPGIGHRLDGWPNRDLNVGAIVSLAPDLRPVGDALGVDVAAVKKVLAAWGPGRYDAELNVDGKAFRPDGKTAATLLPAAFGLAGINLHTYTGWGSVTYWNAYVAVTQMHGKGTFYDPRLNNRRQFPLAVRNRLWNVRSSPDLITPRLAALHYYQLSIGPPKPPPGSFDPQAAARGRLVFLGQARCGTCHAPPLFAEPGWPMHRGAEIGIDEFQANRSPARAYRTTPLAGLFTRTKGGFYHDGRFPDLRAVVDHYDRFFRLNLSRQQKGDLIEFLKSL